MNSRDDLDIGESSIETQVAIIIIETIVPFIELMNEFERTGSLSNEVKRVAYRKEEINFNFLLERMCKSAKMKPIWMPDLFDTKVMIIEETPITIKAFTEAAFKDNLINNDEYKTLSKVFEVLWTNRLKTAIPHVVLKIANGNEWQQTVQKHLERQLDNRYIKTSENEQQKNRVLDQFVNYCERIIEIFDELGASSFVRGG